MKLIPQTALVLAALTLPHAAIAHPGDHGALTTQALVEHFWTSPFHILPLTLAVLAIAGIVLGLRKAGRLPTRRDRTVDAAKPDPSQARQATDAGNDSERQP